MGSQVSTGAKRNRADDAASPRRFDSVTSSQPTINFALSAELPLQPSNKLAAKILLSPQLTVVYFVLMDFRDYENYWCILMLMIPVRMTCCSRCVSCSSSPAAVFLSVTHPHLHLQISAIRSRARLRSLDVYVSTEWLSYCSRICFWLCPDSIRVRYAMFSFKCTSFAFEVDRLVSVLCWWVLVRFVDRSFCLLTWACLCIDWFSLKQ